jgi:hypothetical protein
MKTDAVIGCDAVDAGPEVVRLKTTSGETRTIPWDSIRVAGTAPNLENHVAILEVAEQVAPYLGTHDSLWIVYENDGFVRAMLEKSSPKRDLILAAFQRSLGDRWRGDALHESDLAGPMLIPPKVQMPKSMVAMMAVLGIVFFLALAILFFVHGAKPTSP